MKKKEVNKMNTKLITTLMVVAVLAAACSPVPATGGSPNVNTLPNANTLPKDLYGFGSINPYLNPNTLKSGNQVIPPIEGGSNANTLPNDLYGFGSVNPYYGVIPSNGGFPPFLEYASGSGVIPSTGGAAQLNSIGSSVNLGSSKDITLDEEAAAKQFGTMDSLMSASSATANIGSTSDITLDEEAMAKQFGNMSSLMTDSGS